MRAPTNAAVETDRGEECRSLDAFEHVVPADFALAVLGCILLGEPDKRGASNDVGFRHKTPHARVGGTVPVVAHHPIVVEAKRIRCCGLTIDAHVIA